MTYQQFDEKLQHLFEISPAREQKIRARWQRITRRGPLFFILTRSLLHFAWMVVCLAFFSWRLHTLHVYQDHFVAPVALVTLLYLSFIFAAVAYLMARNAVAGLDKRERVRSRNALHRRIFTSPAARRTAP